MIYICIVFKRISNYNGLKHLNLGTMANISLAGGEVIFSSQNAKK
jgi:hypothetical protein